MISSFGMIVTYSNILGEKKLLNLDGERKFVRTLLTFHGTWQGNKLKTSKKDFLDTFCFMNIPTGYGDQ